MKHSLKIDGNGFLTVKTEGDGDVEGIIAFLKDIVSHPQWKSGNNILLDHRALSINAITASGIEEVSAFFKKIAHELGNGRIALVMNRDIDFGIARAWENITEYDVDIKICVFRELDKAISWLNK